MSAHFPPLVPGVMAEANIAGTYYVCSIASGPDSSQMYQVRFSNGAAHQVHVSAIRMNAPAPSAPVVIAASAAVATTPAAIPVVAASYPTNGKAPLHETPVASTSYHTPAASYPTPAASYPTPAASYPTPAAQATAVAPPTGIYPIVPSAFIALPAAAPVVVMAPPAAVVVAAAPAPIVIASYQPVAVAAGPRFVVGEEVEALFRENWFVSKIIKSFGNGKYKVKYLKSNSFGTVDGQKLRKKNRTVVRKTVVTTKQCCLRNYGQNPVVMNVAAPVVVSAPVMVVSAPVMVAPPAVPATQRYKVVTTTTTKRVGRKNIITKTTKRIPIPAASSVVTTTTTKRVGRKNIITKTTKRIPIPAGSSVAAPKIVTTAQKFKIVVPAGARPGQVIRIATPGGKQASVAIPAGLRPGQSFYVTLA